jgi:hypothetical protein
MSNPPLLPLIARRQRGVAVLLTMILVLMIAAVGVTRYASSGASASGRQVADNAAQLAIVRTALLAYAVNGRNPGPAACGVNVNWRPGELPCPDRDNDGIEECTCAGAEQIGRVPWKTLGIPDPKDAAGETLWYVVSSGFRAANAYAGATAINSDTKGDLIVWKDDLVNQHTAEAIAVIIAPGSVVGAQARSAVITADCTVTGSVIAQNRCSSNYMETSPGGGRNWLQSGQFVMGLTTPAPQTFNDQVLALTTADLMPLVEQRVGKDVNELLKLYKRNSACACFPWADGNWDGVSDAPTVYGNVPLVTALPEAWGSGAIPAVTAYLTQNNWWRVLFYAVGNRITAVPPDAMTIDLNGGGWDTSTVLITPGPAGNTRPSTDWSNYISDATNRDNDRHFISPTSTNYARNRLFSIPYPFP